MTKYGIIYTIDNKGCKNIGDWETINTNIYVRTQITNVLAKNFCP